MIFIPFHIKYTIKKKNLRSETTKNKLKPMYCTPWSNAHFLLQHLSPLSMEFYNKITLKSYCGTFYRIMRVRKTKCQRTCLHSVLHTPHTVFGRTQKRGEKTHSQGFRQHIYILVATLNSYSISKCFSC